MACTRSNGQDSFTEYRFGQDNDNSNSNEKLVATVIEHVMQQANNWDIVINIYNKNNNNSNNNKTIIEIIVKKIG